jgi:hypothetical protein
MTMEFAIRGRGRAGAGHAVLAVPAASIGDAMAEAFEQVSFEVVGHDGRTLTVIRRQAIVAFQPANGPLARRKGRSEYLLADGRYVKRLRGGKAFRISGTVEVFKVSRPAAVAGAEQHRASAPIASPPASG